MKRLILNLVLSLLTTVALAENPINTQTKTWKHIPITVDANNHTYSTAKGFLMPEGNYYYTYSGYRCLNEKPQIARVNPVVLKPKNAKGTVIYCYPDK
ncbi:hypothetical protein [Legionella rowbothamii]|uniref:hypothetical protein n=1 Tax=Legionella rowbothamii TaxID=96229 RepID=UPI001055FAB5|nr:hypothetical protein [Legionella rowbothamii]